MFSRTFQSPVGTDSSFLCDTNLQCTRHLALLAPPLNFWQQNCPSTFPNHTLGVGHPGWEPAVVVQRPRPTPATPGLFPSPTRPWPPWTSQFFSKPVLPFSEPPVLCSLPEKLTFCSGNLLKLWMCAFPTSLDSMFLHWHLGQSGISTQVRILLVCGSLNLQLPEGRDHAHLVQSGLLGQDPSHRPGA